MTINLEMMKQLLQEFAEKEALTNAEIKVVEEQRLELEGRIVKCQDRLRLVSEDKVKISQMMQRYVGSGVLNGARSVPGAALIQNRMPVASAPPAEAPAPRPGRRSADASASMQAPPPPAPAPMPAPEPTYLAPQPPPEPIAPPPQAAGALSPSQFFDDPAPAPAPPPPLESQTYASAQDLVGSLSDGLPPEPPPAPHEAPPAAAASGDPASPADEPAPDDTVKSINDALRGLFR